MDKARGGLNSRGSMTTHESAHPSARGSYGVQGRQEYFNSIRTRELDPEADFSSP